jgi:hypothetical protein
MDFEPENGKCAPCAPFISQTTPEADKRTWLPMTQGNREVCWCLFLHKAARILCASSIRMNNGTSGSRIADSQAGNLDVACK